jgi:hypothetical protein
MAIRLDDVRAFGHALPAPFLKLKLETELQRHKLLRKNSGTDAQKLTADWDFYRNKLRALGQGLSERVKNHVLEPLVGMLGYEEVVAADDVVTREGKENGGLLFRGKDGASLRAWAVARDTDLDAPSKRGRAYRFSPARIAHRVLEQTGEHLGLLTDGTELRLLLRDPGRADSHLVLPLERDGGWRSAREAPDSFRLLLALGSPKGVQAIPHLIDAARGAQREVTKKLRQQARAAVEQFVQGVYDNPKNADQRAAWQQLDSDERIKLAKDLWREGLILVYRLLFVLKLESDADPARVFSFAATSLWRQTFSPSTALAPIVRRVLDDGADTGGLLEGGLRSLFRLFVEGLVSRELTVRPLGGALFGPEAMPRLEALRWGERAVSHLLDALLWTPADGKVERERVHYGTLDVEDLGSVYEALLELEPGIATEPMCRLRRAKLEVVVPAAQGDPYRAAPRAAADVDEEEDAEEADEDGEEEKKSKGKTKVAFVEDIPAGRFFLRTGLGRKSSGSYYTPQAFVRFLVEETLGPQLRERSPKDDPKPAAILALKVLDPAMGSGHFLVEACRHLGSALYEACRLCDELASKAEADAAKAGASEREALLARATELRSRVEVLPDPQDELVAYLPSRASEGGDTGLSQRKAEALCRRLVAVHCLYGVDLNPLAVELARLSLWLESYAEGLPLTFLDHRLLQGNSLTGPFFKDLLTWPVSRQPLADLMFRGLAQSLEQRRAEAVKLVEDLEASVGRDVADLVHKQKVKEQLDAILQPFRVLAAAWSGMVMLGERGDDAPFRELAQAVATGAPTGPVIAANANLSAAVAVGSVGISYDLCFPEVFTAGQGGFDAVLGNPPWDAIHFKSREFLAGFDLGVLEAETPEEKERVQARLLTMPEVARRHHDAEADFERQKLVNDRLYQFQKVFIDNDLAGRQLDAFRVFMERNQESLRPMGLTGVVVPSSFHANAGATGVRQLYLKKMRLDFCFSFENAKKLFEIDSRMKFAVVVAANDPEGTREFSCAFYLHDLDWLFGERRPMRYSLAFVQATSGQYLNLLELQRPEDAEIAQQMFSCGRPFQDACQRSGIRLGAECHMRNDRHRFTPVGNVTPGDPRNPQVATEVHLRGYLPMHEGKTFHQYNDHWGDRPRYAVALTALADKQDWIRAARHFRLAYREIASSGNERTSIFCLIPPGYIFGHKGPCERHPERRPHHAALELLAVANSFAFDFALRLRVSSTVSWFMMAATPIPVLSATGARFLADQALRLSCSHPRFRHVWAEFFASSCPMPDPLVSGESPQSWEYARASIDAVVAYSYKLNRDQLATILSTFKHKTHPEAASLCLRAFDELLLNGLENFARKHDPYFDIPTSESLPQPAVDFAIPEQTKVSVTLSKSRPTQSPGPMLPFREPAPARATHIAEPRPTYSGADHATTLLTLLQDHGSITCSDAQTATGLDAAGVRPLLQRLVDDGHATVEGQKRGTRYVRRTDG